MKKTVLLITALLMLVTLCIGMTLSTSAEDVIHTGTWGNNLAWELNVTTGHLTISGEGEMDAFSTATDAWRNYKTSIKSVTIENDITNIGGSAFSGCKSLASITIPDSVTSIGSCAFDGCSSLTSINIPDGVTSIGYNAFFWCKSLTSINIPNGVTSIRAEAFLGCSSLASINIPDSVTSIEGGAFSNCSSLASINIPDGVTSIGYNAFFWCKSLTSINIPNGVTSINGNTFYCCSSLTSINIPDGVTSIGHSAFDSCSSLTNITIPDSVTSIEGQAFYNCSSLASINIPEGVTSIGSRAFYGCKSLASINIPDGVTSIRDGAFWGCSSLASINIPDGVTSVRDGAFWGCSSLASINIPNSVTSIGSSAFEGCSSLTSINIPNGVTSIGHSAFSDCSSLEEMIYCGTEEEWALLDYNTNKPVFHKYHYTKIDSEKHSVVCRFCSNEMEASHTWNNGEITTPATHLTVGVKTYTCTGCRGTKTEDVPKLTEHTYGDWQKHNETQHKHSCECGEIQYADHVWNSGEITTQPTHIAIGVKTYACIDCKQTKTEDIPKLSDHTFSNVWVTHDDEQHKKLCECGEALYDYHRWDRGVLNENERKFTCYDCGYTMSEPLAPAEKGGCSGSAMGSLSLLLLLPAAFALWKKKED